MPDDPVAELYGLPLDEFVDGRDALARELRAEGEKERAAEVAKLKKPSVAAWAVNQLARKNRKQLDLLLDAGHRLRAEQEELLKGGDRKKFEGARRDHERAVRELVAAAGKLLEKERGASSEQVLASVDRTLRYASIDEEQRALLASGRLTAEVDAPGFGAFTGFDLPPATAGRPPSPQKQGEPPKHEPNQQQQRQERQKRIAVAEEALKLARDREREARQQLREAEQAERRAAKDFDRATKDLAAARNALDEAGAAVKEASEGVKTEKRAL